MKVLFVCKYNMGRSRMAEFIFNNITKKNHADSVGVYTYYYLKKYHARMPQGDPTIIVMKELGIDVSKKPIKQVSKSIVRNSDIIIVIMTKGRADKDLPSYIKKSRNFRLWIMEDINGTLNLDSQLKGHRENRDKILFLVKKLIKEIG